MQQPTPYEANAAMWQEFPLKERRHGEVQQGGSSKLDDSLVPQAEQQNSGRKAFSRAAHDTQQQDLARTQNEQQSSSWMSSYTAQTAGHTEVKKRTGKKCFNAPTQTGFFGGSGGTQAQPAPSAVLASFALGTTKGSQHIPGYTGHIAAQPESRSHQVQVRDHGSTAAALMTTNGYNNVFPGYTGRAGR
mmetsp:Transcript_5886/g.10237  ORF Transcript_5886/g.10237 Transcript_5886/m.10237 type:complete len:189 (-) Transcript_5886:264-830(-)